MKNKAITSVFVASLCVAMLFTETSSFFWRRRRRRRSPPPPDPPCHPQDCTIRWSDWSGCSWPCGNGGIRTRQRIIITSQNHCGSCPYAAQETEACNTDASLCLHGSTPASNGCTCRSGWTGTCCGDDINECLSNPCAHDCDNYDGGFSCDCFPCYEKAGFRCELKQCKINGQCHSYNTVNPSNQCQKCDSGHLMGWTNDDSLSCNDGIACTRNDHCSSGTCIGTPFTCLSCEECYNDACRVKSGNCTIVEGGTKTCFSHGDLRQGYPCQQCDSNNQHQWTNNNNLPCSDNNLQTKDDRCMNGVCAGTSYNCLSCEAHDGSGCQLQPGYCIIEQGGQQTCFATNHLKPGNPCQWCDPGGSTSTWTNRGGVACNDSNHCTSGDTCIGGQCRATPFSCNSVCQYCNGSGCSLKTGFGFANNKCTCKIGGQDYDHQTVNPSNQCQWCDLYDSAVRTNGAWSNRPSVPCDDQNTCTKQDTCSTGRCSGQNYSCQSSYPSSSCVKTSQCLGNGTCASIMRSSGTICRSAVDICDQPERCNGVLGACPPDVLDNIVVHAGKVQFMDSKFQSPRTYQYTTDKLFLEISGFSVSCGEMYFSWYLLAGTSPCSLNSVFNGSLPDNSVHQIVTGVTLQDNQSYKVAIKVSDMRHKTYQVVCSSALLVDTSTPQGGWIRDGPGADLSYQASTLLQVNWGGVQTRNGVAKYQWKVILTPLNSNQTVELLPFTNVNLSTSVQKAFSNVTDGSKVRFVVRAFTKAGLFSDLTSNGVVIDTSPPVAGMISDGTQAGLDVKYAKWTNSFTANWDRFSDPHSSIFQYTWAVQRQDAGLVTSFRTTALNRSSTATNLNLVSGESYCAVVRGYNEAGLYSQAKSDCVLIDQDAPQAGNANDGHFTDIDYQSEDTMIAANWNDFSDGSWGSGIVEYRYKITDNSGSVIVSWTSVGNATNITRTRLALKNNTRYFVTVKAVDAVGLSIDVTTDGVTVDTTHPVFTGTVVVIGEDDVTNGTSCVYIPSISSVAVQWVGFSDAHSGLQRYEWAIVPSGKSPPNSDFAVVSDPNLPTSATFRNLSLSQGKGYHVVIRAYNGANLYKDAYSVVIIPDSTPPAAGKVFDGSTHGVSMDYQANLKHVYGYWSKFAEPHTSVKQYYYAVGSCTTGNYHVTGNRFMKLDSPTATSLMLANVTLVNGQKYCIKIKAENKAGLFSSEVSSDGFVADVTPPNTLKAQVRDGNTGLDIDYQDNTTAMSAVWEGFADPESGIQFYEFGISRNRAGTPDVSPFRNVGRNTSATARGLSLTDDVYYFVVCAANNAGLRKCISSDGVLVDLSLPSHGVVYDGIIEPDLKYQSSLSTMAANWEGIWDLESGIEKFEWSIGTSVNEKASVMDVTDVGLSTHVTSKANLNLSSGTKYFVHLKVTNEAGSVRDLVSDGVVADGTPPIPTTIYPGFGSQDGWIYNKKENAFYCASPSSIAVYWKKFPEPESEVWYYKWGIGTTKCGTQVQPLINIGRLNYANTTMTDLIFRPGVKYYATVTSRNRAGLVSRSCSEALVIDNTPPNPGKVLVGHSLPYPETKTFISNRSVVISWVEFSDLESGIKTCNISVLDQAGRLIYHQISNASSGNITLLNVHLPHGGYNATAECKNNAGLSSSSSSVFIIDNTPPLKAGPLAAGFSRDGNFQYQSDDKSINASWPPFLDPESGIAQYYVAIGTRPYQDDVVSFENVHLATRITTSDLSLSQGGIYYITVIAVNFAGLQTNISSDGLVIDTSSPLGENDDIKDGFDLEDIDFFSPKMRLSAHWEAITDPESGIMQSQYCLGTKPHGCQIIPMTSVGKNKSFSYLDHTVREGTKVYVTVQVTNGAGLCKTRSSDGMLLDVSPPLVGDIIDGSGIPGVDYNVVLESWNVAMTWLGGEDAESGIKSCSWTIESNSGVILYKEDIGNSSTYGERNIFSVNLTYQNLHFIRNMTYYNVLKCLNNAELQATERSNGFNVEPIWPIPGKVRDGSRQGKDLVYLTSTKIVGANWNLFYADSKDPVVDYEVAVGTAAGKSDIRRYTSVGLRLNAEMDLAPGIPDLDVLKVGATYYMTVKATSSSGLSSAQYSDGFMVDPSPPMLTELSVSHKVIDQSTKTIEVSVSWDDAGDSESGISSSGYCLGTTPYSCGSGFVPVGSSTFGTIGPFSPDWWVEYYVTVVVENGAGLRTVISSKKLVFDTTPPSEGIVIDGFGHDIDFMHSTSVVSIQWEGFEDEESGISSCSWSLVEQVASYNRSAYGNDTIVFSQTVERNGNFSRGNLSLFPGARYINKITCTNGDGFSATSFSDGVIVDLTPPNPGLVHDGSTLTADVEYQSSTAIVKARWTLFQDQESGVMEYRWGLGTSLGDVNTVNFTATGKLTSGQAENLTLFPGVRYFVAVEATNGAGLVSHGWSNGFTVDVSPPELTEVSAGSEHWIGPIDFLHAKWKSQDPESGISKTEYCVGTLPVGCQIKPMTEIAANSTEVSCKDCRLNHYGSYYISIRVTNGAGLIKVIATNETRVDLTAPILGDIVLQLLYTSCVTNCTLTANVTRVQDEESGVKLCSYAVRNGSAFVTDFVDYGMNPIVEATGLHLQAGEIYDIVVKCENNVGLATERASSPVRVDNTPPSKGSVIVSKDRTHDVFGLHSSCHLFNKTLRAHWHGFNDNESEISGFRVAVGRQPNATDVLQFQDVGLTTNVSLALTNNTFDGDIVYVTVESRNSAGLVTLSTSPATRLVAADDEEYIKQGDFHCLNV